MTQIPREEETDLKSYVFKVTIENDAFEDGRTAFHAHCPALKGCRTWGHTYEEALTNIKEAVELYVEDLVRAGEPIPTGTDGNVIEFTSPAVAVNV